MKGKRLFLMSVAVTLVFLRPATAGEADVLAVDVIQTGDRVYTFDVTVQHGDTGWGHYADRWDVVAPDGEVLGSRVLLHPHVGEQPFTRSLSNVTVPDGIDEVELRAHDSEHGLGGAILSVAVP